MESIWLKWLGPAVTLIAAAALCVSVVLLVIDLNHPQPSPADQARADTAKLLMAALEKYRSAKGAYPLLINNPISDLKPTLVDGGFLKEIPRDLPDAQPMRYISNTGTSYGILSTKNRKPCLIEVGVSNTQWWALTSADWCSYN
jgi:type II secretory pathway pseudopilin PulG